VRPGIRLLLTLLMMPPLAAAEEAPFAVAVVGAKDAGHWPFALVAPLEEAPFAVAGASAKDAGQWPNSLATPRLAAGGEARAAVGGAWQRPYAQTGSSEPSEEAPIPFEGAAPSPGARWPLRPSIPGGPGHQARLHIAPAPRCVHGLHLCQRDIKISSVSLGVNGVVLLDT